MTMHKQSDSKTVRSKAAHKIKKAGGRKTPKRLGHGPPKKPATPLIASGLQRSGMHWNTAAEIAKLEQLAQEKAEVKHRENGNGFVRDRDGGGFEVRDDLAEQLTEEYLISAVSGEET